MRVAIAQLFEKIMKLNEFISADHNILVVDDVPSALKIVTRLLIKLGVKNVSEATNGEDAIKRLQEKQCDLIISDWNMPGMDGIQLLSKVRDHARFKEIPFILITSSADRDEVVQAYKTGVSDYIVKPFNGETLARKIELVLAKIVFPSTHP